jgi:aspartate kinase
MLVYKFGGASIADAGRMASLLPLVKDSGGPLVVVMSALGKTTNALEAIVNAACQGRKEEAIALAKKLEQQHLDYARQLLDDVHYAKAAAFLSVHFTALEKAASAADPKYYDRSYDQVVCLGEIFSTVIFSFWLIQNGIVSEWVDIRKVISTDDTFRDAVVDWETSLHNSKDLGKILEQGKVIITQGFIGSTQNGLSVTLGREGSDYTAAVLAAMLGAASVTIWKDVEGLQNADPKQFPNTVKINEISYNEVIEMAFYGAQIIHPKTIKPLQNNHIPFYIKCFLDPKLEGTVIKQEVSAAYPPLIALKENQVLIQATTRDFSFITEDNLSKLYSIFHDLKVKINLIQNAAISFVACIDNREDKIRALIPALSGDYKVTVNEQVTLLTIRHYTPESINDLINGRHTLLRQETRKTVQVVLDSSPVGS